MTVKFTNNASTTVATGINTSATSLTVASASAFPQLAGADDYCYLTIQQATGTGREVVKATALSTNTFTITRAQDGTSAGTWSAGDIVELRMTAALLTDVIDAATVDGVKSNFQYTPTAGQTVFSGADNSSNTLVINQSGLVNTYMNGVRLVQGTDYTVSAANNTITLTTGATTSDIIDVEVYGNFTGQSGAAVAITGGSITGTAITATTLGASGTATLNTFVSNNSTISGGTINNVAIGGTTQAAGSFSDLTATTSLQVPSGTTAQRPSSPAAGSFRYNTTSSQFEGYSSSWGAISGGGGGGGATSAFSVDSYTANGSTTAFAISQSVSSENNLIVFIEGVFQQQDAYVLSGNTLTFVSAPANGNKILIYSIAAAVSGSNLNIDSMTGDGSDTTLTLSIIPVSENNTQVFVDGVYQSKSNYSVSGSTLTFSTAPPSGSAVEVMTLTQTDINVPADNTITSAKLSGDLTTPGALAVTGALTGTSATFTTADNSDNLTLTSTDADASSGPNVKLYRNSSSPADNDFLGNIKFVGRNDNSQDVQYAEQEVYILDASDGTEDGLYNVNVMTAGANLSYMQFKAGSGVVFNEDSNDIDFRVESDNSTHALFVQGSDGNVGIGATSPSSTFRTSIRGDGSSIIGGIEFGNAASGGGETFTIGHTSATSTSGTINVVGAGNLIFKTNNTERARISSDGDLFFAKNTGDTAQVGHIMQTNGAMFHTMQDGPPLRLRRNTSDGVSIEISKDGNSCGHIGTHSGDEVFFGNSSNIGMRTEQTGADRFEPCTGAGAARNNAIDLGIAGNQWRSIFCQAVTESSDRSLKQDIEELSDSEQRVAVRAKSLLRKYRFISDVENGDNRYSVGIIAQDLQDAFTAEGLDAANYKMWRSDTFVDEATGQEKTQQSIIYSQLLAFIISAI